VARIEGVDLPRNKRVDIALTYIYGIGRATAKVILDGANVAHHTRTQDLTEVEVAAIREVIQRGHKVEGDLRKEIAMSIKRLIDINCYRGNRHKRACPCAASARTPTPAPARGPAAPSPVAGSRGLRCLLLVATPLGG
jgi:small subunit ribosomal protein S13